MSIIHNLNFNLNLVNDEWNLVNDLDNNELLFVNKINNGCDNRRKNCIII